MTRAALLLSLLEDAGEVGITTAEILQAGVGSRYGARILELRKAGHQITSERIRDGAWLYKLDTEVVSVGTGGQRGVEPPGHLFNLPDAYDDLKRKDFA